MGRELPMLFNTEMVQAIQGGRKTVTRRLVKYKYDNTVIQRKIDKYGKRLIEIERDVEGETYGRNPDGTSWFKLRPYLEKEPPCKKGDLLYVRESWAYKYCMDCLEDGCCQKTPDYGGDGDCEGDGCYLYRADYSAGEAKRITWRPSIHMPKQAARIWLKVTEVRAQRLSEMRIRDFLREGAVIPPEAYNDPANACRQARGEFSRIWDSTLKSEELARYGFAADPWVWAIEFERCDMF